MRVLRTIFSFCILTGFLWGCQEEVIEPESLILTRLLPYAAYGQGPVLIEGEGFTDSTTVDFNGYSANILDFNSTQISTRIPAAFVGYEGQALMTVSNGAVQAQSLIRIKKEGFESVTFNAPQYYLGNRLSTGFTAYPTVDCQDSICTRNLQNVFGYLINPQFFNRVSLTDTLIYEDGKLVASKMAGFEIGVANRNVDLTAAYVYDTNTFTMQRDEGETLTGGFYRLSLSTPSGTKTGDFLYLISDDTGLPFLYEPQ